MRDPLKGALPVSPNTASPALTGAPPSITGGVGDSMIPPMNSGGPALAPAPSPGGAQVAGEPLSSSTANEPQGGVGADFDLVKDRGTPEEFHMKNVQEAGSDKATKLAFDIIGGRNNNRIGVLDEEIRRQGARMNAALGMETPEKAKAVVNDMVFKPMLATMKAEVKSEVITEGEAVDRYTKIKVGTEGAQDIDTLKKVSAEAHNDVTGEKIKPKDVEKQSWWDGVKKWWDKGKNDPNEQVTGFMGGMNRNELGMFVFQWGAMMMAGSSEGFGAAMGGASLGAMQGHQGRKAEAAGAALEERKVAAQEQTADAATMTAEAAKTRAGAIGAGYQGKDKFLLDYYRSQDMSEKEIRDRLGGAYSPEKTYDLVAIDVADMVAKAKADPPMIPSEYVMVDVDGDGKNVKPLHKLTPQEEAKLAKTITDERMKMRDSLRPEPENKTASDYLNAAQQ